MVCLLLKEHKDHYSCQIGLPGSCQGRAREDCQGGLPRRIATTKGLVGHRENVRHRESASLGRLPAQATYGDTGLPRQPCLMFVQFCPLCWACFQHLAAGVFPTVTVSTGIDSTVAIAAAHDHLGTCSAQFQPRRSHPPLMKL